MRKDKEQQEAAEEQVKSSDTVESKAAGQTEETSGAAKVADQETKTEDASEKMAAEIAEWRDKYVRLSAEFDNYRKRTLKEKMDLMSSAGEDVIKSLLPVMDDLERALAATEKASDVAAVREGVVLISNKLRDTLRGRALIWYNTLWDTLCGGHDDDLSLEDPDAAFGYLVDTLGARIIQTDRAEHLLDYLRRRGLHD